MNTLDEHQVLDLLKPGMRVLLGGGVASPNGMIRLLNQHPERTAGVELYQARVPAIPASDVEHVGEGATLTTIFMSRGLEGKPWVRFVPTQYRRFYEWLRQAKVDLVLVRGTRGADGGANLGFSADFAPAVLEGGARLVAEVSSHDPLAAIAPIPNSQQVVGMFDSDEQLPAATPSSQNSVAEAIGRHVAELIQDGDTVQTGVGAIPDAVLDSLGGHRDLGFHSGMLCDGARRLIDAGVVNGRRKSRDRETHVTGFLFGESEHYEWAADRTDIAIRPVSYTHDAAVLGSIDDLVIVNSAVQVDLFGQVNAEMIGGRQISGTGGAVDFFRGAALGHRGRSIVALPATAARGETSRIVAKLESPGVATALRTDCDFIVTEYGVARLSERSIEERAEALLQICAPEFRETLQTLWRELAASS